VLPFKGRDRRRVAADEAAQASWRPSPPVPLGVWGQEAAMPSNWHRDPRRPPILSFQLPHLTLGTGISSQGCGVESPTGKSEQPEGAAREDPVDLR
jgi:hypothetical protein